MDPRGGLKTNVKQSISRACHFERSERSLPFAVGDSRFPHMCRALLCFSHLSFIPLEPYPARYARYLPHAGKALSVVILFPHMRVFALRLWGKRYSRIVAFPIGEGGPRQWRSGTFVSGALEMIFPALFHAARTLSGSLCSPPSPWGKAYNTGYAFLSFVFMPARVLLLLAIPQSRFPVCKEDFSLRSK